MKHTRRALLTVSLALFGLLTSPFLPAAPPPARFPAAPDAQQYVEHVRYLASEDLRGRATGSPELEKAARYISRQFRDYGLQPLGQKDYLQPFQVTTNARLGKNNRLSWSDGKKTVVVKYEDEFQPFNFSARGPVDGQVVFAGYGITAAEYNYDDYKGLDAKGKIVLVLRHEPQEFDEKSVFAGKIYTEHSQFFSKLTNAKNHGATGVILINDTGNHRGEADELEPFGKTAGPGNGGIPFVQIKAAIAEEWLSESGHSLTEIQEQIDGDLRPRSFPLNSDLHVSGAVDVERAVKTAHNVIGYLPGETDEYIVIGAHYDHLGLGEQFSMAPALAGTIHPGADDNASGTAAVLQLAKYFGSGPKLKRGIVFMTFAGEELGLLGSSYYVNHPILPLEKCVAMINMDMIGRPREEKIYIGGTGTGSTFQSILGKVMPESPLKIDFSDKTGYGSSDHTSFTTKQIPVLFFFSGLHSDYHKPSDTWDKINGPEAIEVVRLVAATATALIDANARPEFVRVEPAHSAHGGDAAGVSSAGSGYGAYFGSIPDFGEIPNGVKFADVREGSPAAKAGLKAGDILIEFASKPIQNLYDFTYALRTHKPGEEVEVKVKRGDETVTAKVLLEKRTK